jgi:hypothetical protein
MTAKTPPQAISEPLDPFAQDPHYLREVAKLQSLLSRGNIEEARRFVRELEQRWPDSDLVRRFAHVLAPPVARVVQGRKGMSREQTEKESVWLREHAREYPGCWVVLDGDRLIAAHPSLRTVTGEADRVAGSEVGSLHYIRPGVVGV